VPEGLGAVTSAATCETEVMTINGESPSPGMMWEPREPESDCLAARRGGKQLEGSWWARRRRSTGVEADSAGGTRRACVVRAKPGTGVSCKADTKRISEPTLHNPNVFGTGTATRRRHGLRYETCVGCPTGAAQESEPS